MVQHVHKDGGRGRWLRQRQKPRVLFKLYFLEFKRRNTGLCFIGCFPTFPENSNPPHFLLFALSSFFVILLFALSNYACLKACPDFPAEGKNRIPFDHFLPFKNAYPRLRPAPFNPNLHLLSPRHFPYFIKKTTT